MKKTVSIVLAIIMILAFAACGEKPEAAKNAMADLYEQGFELRAYSMNEEKFAGMMQKEDSQDLIYKVSAPLTSELYEKINTINAEDDEEAAKNFYTALENLEVEEIQDLLPTQEELDQYIGKTLGDLEADGYEKSGYSGWEGVYSFYYDGPVWDLSVELKEGTLIEDLDDYSENDLRQLEIGSVTFNSLSFNVIDIDAE